LTHISNLSALLIPTQISKDDIETAWGIMENNAFCGDYGGITLAGEYYECVSRNMLRDNLLVKSKTHYCCIVSTRMGKFHDSRFIDRMLKPTCEIFNFPLLMIFRDCSRDLISLCGNGQSDKSSTRGC
jgi:hypothetical protein